MDRALAEIAGRQHGILARSQLRPALADVTIDRWVADGAPPPHPSRGLCLGHTAITQRGRWMAAVLASGPGAVLSHRSATALWGTWGSGTGEAHVTVPRKAALAEVDHGGILESWRDEVAESRRDSGDLGGAEHVATSRRTKARRRRRRRSGRWNTSGSTARFRCLRSSSAIRAIGGRRSSRGVSTGFGTTPEVGSAARSRKSFLPFLVGIRSRRPKLNAWLASATTATRSIASGPTRASSASSTASGPTAPDVPSARTASATVASASTVSTSSASPKTNFRTNRSKWRRISGDLALSYNRP